MLVVLIPIIELVSWLGLRFEENHFSFQHLSASQEQLAASGVASKDRAEVLHPYMGWSLNPQTRAKFGVAGTRVPVNNLGFVDDGPSLRKRSADRLIVGISGGSVAQQMGVMGSEALRNRLSENPRLKGKKIVLVRMAFAGFKQPQQLMALAYLLSLGGQFDAVVNIDGFNEIALAPCENREVDVSAAYPRLWPALTADLVDPRRYADSYRLLELRAARQAAARAIVGSPIRFSPTRNLLWRIRDAYLEHQIASLGEEILAARQSNGQGFAASGPHEQFPNQDAFFEHLIEIWRDSSRQMGALCRGNGIAYIHVLQPNQYVPGSKPIGPEERKAAIEERCFAVSVRKAYPLLIRDGEKLRQAGLNFHDLTRLFAATTGPIYVDTCCHYNQTGNDLLATAVADAILDALDHPPR